MVPASHYCPAHTGHDLEPVVSGCHMACDATGYAFDCMDSVGHSTWFSIPLSGAVLTGPGLRRGILHDLVYFPTALVVSTTELVNVFNGLQDMGPAQIRFTNDDVHSLASHQMLGIGVL